MEFNSNHAKQNSNEKLKIDQSDISNFYDSDKLKIDLTENLEITTNDMIGQEKQDALTEISETHKSINLSERLEVSTNDFDQAIIVAIKHGSDKNAVIESILNTKRIRFNGKLIFAEDMLLKERLGNDKSYNIIEDTRQFSDQLYNADHIENNAITTSAEILLVRLTGEESVTSNNEISVFLETTVENSFIRSIHKIADTKNPPIFFLLVPLSWHVLIYPQKGFRRQKLIKIGTVKNEYGLSHYASQ